MEVKIISQTRVGEYYHIIKLTKPQGYEFKAGQFAKFTLPVALENDKNFRMFSIASTPEEDYILLATKALPDKTSPFKQALFAMQEGEALDMGKPLGHFTLRDDSTPMVLYASGIGVTPIRSLVKHIAGSAKQDMKIVYASYDNYIFEDEFEALAKAHSNIEFMRTIEIPETMGKLASLCKQYGNAAWYYISGAPFVVNAVREAYTKDGIIEDKFIDDVFVGYEEG